ncbi:OmpH family outer membrane protein [Planctomycetota bacterium]
MKIRTVVVLSMCAIALVLSTGIGLRAESAGIPMDKVGVVSLMRILRDSQKNVAHMREMATQQARMQGELQTMNTELETDKAVLQTYVAGSEDYLANLKGVVMKQATLQAQKEFFEQSMAATEREWTEKMYKEILEITRSVADEKGLAIVFSRTEPTFPIPAEQFLFTVSSHKVLYAEGCVDLTDEVMSVIDQPIGPAAPPK